MCQIATAQVCIASGIIIIIIIDALREFESRSMGPKRPDNLYRFCWFFKSIPRWPEFLSCFAEPLQKKKKKFETMPNSMAIYKGFYVVKVVCFAALCSEWITMVKKTTQIGKSKWIIKNRVDIMHQNFKWLN